MSKIIKITTIYKVSKGDYENPDIDVAIEELIKYGIKGTYGYAHVEEIGTEYTVSEVKDGES